ADLVEGGPHVAQPGVPLRFPDREMRVPHAQPRVTASLLVRARPAPVLDQEEPQVLLGRPEVLAGVDGAQRGIASHPAVEGVHQVTEGPLAAHGLVEGDRFGYLFHAGVQGSRRTGLPTCRACGAATVALLTGQKPHNVHLTRRNGTTTLIVASRCLFCPL